MGVDLKKLNSEVKQDNGVDLTKLNSELKNSNNQEQKYISPEYSSKEGIHNIDVSKYSSYIPTGVFDNQYLDETRAQSQSTLGRWANAVPRLASKVTTEILKTPAYLYAVGEALSTDKSLAESLDNAWLNTLQGLDNKTKEEFAIYTPKAVKEGSLWNNLQSASFYTNEGVDGLGFLVSMLVPGAALKGLGMASKLAKLGGNTVKATKLANNIELGTMTLMNTTLESASETKGLIDNLKPELQANVDNGKINSKTGLPWTEADVTEALDNAAKGSFLTNMALLAGPNLLMNKNLLGRFNPTKSTMNKVIDESGKFVDISPLTKKQLIKDYAKSVGTNVFSEGFVEEAGQFAVENYYTKLAKEETTDGLINGIAKEYAEGLFTTEGQKAIFLGGLFGSVSSIIGTKKERKAEDEYTSKLSSILKDNFEGFSKGIEDVYEKSENGKILFDEKGNPQVNKKKLGQLVVNIALESKSAAIKDVYALMGNKEAYEFISNQEFTRFAIPYLQAEGGLEALEKHIDMLSNKMLNVKKQQEGVDDSFSEAQYRNELKQKAKNLQKVYESVDTLIGSIELPITKETEKIGSEFLDRLKNSAFQETAKQTYISDRIKALENDVLQMTMSSTATLPQTKLEIEKAQKQIEEYKKSLEESISNYETIFDKKEQVKAFNAFIKDDDNINEVIKKTEAKEESINTKAELEKIKENITNFAKKITNRTDVNEQLTPKEQEFYDEHKKAIEKELQTLQEIKESSISDEVVSKGRSIDLITGKPSKIAETTWEEFDELKINERYNYYTLDSKRALSPFKTTNGIDDDVKESESTFYRYIEKLKLDGHKLKIVTKNNNPELFNDILKQDKTAAEFEKNNPNYPGIFTVLVDKNNNVIKTDNDKLIVSTLETERRIEDEEILVEDKDEAINALNDLRGKILKETNPNIYLPIIDKSKGIAEFLPMIEGRRQSINVEQSFGPINNLDLELSTQAIDENNPNIGRLKNKEKALVGKLYVFDENNRAFDLIPRNINEQETETIINLLAQKLGVTDKLVDNPTKEIKKLIFFGVSKKGPNKFTLGIKDNILYIGENLMLTPDEFVSEEGLNAVRTLLNNKRVNINKEYDFNDRFVAPKVTNEVDPIIYNTYKEYLLSGENPMFGTDLKPKSEVQYRNMYLKYEPKIIKSELVENNNLENELTIPLENNITEKEIKKAENSVEDEDLNKVFKKRGDGSRKIDLDRLTSIVSDTKTKLNIAEENWFKFNFPNIELVKIKGLIEQQSFGRMLSNGKVLLSDLAPNNTLRHEAFHIVTQLYLSKEEINKLYNEALKQYPNKSDLEIEEILAEDFANYKDSKKVLGNQPVRNTIFRRLLNFIKNLLNIPASSIQEIYDRIDKGYYTNKSMKYNRQFTSLDSQLPGISVVKTKKILDGIDAEFFDILFENSKTPNEAFKNTNRVLDIIHDDFYDRQELLKDLVDKKPTEQRINTLKTYNYILTNWDLIQNIWTERMYSFGIDTRLEEVNNEEDINDNVDLSVVKDENKSDRSGEAYQEANNISAKSTMSKATKLLIRSLKKKRFVLDNNGNKIKQSNGLYEVEDVLNNEGLKETVNFNSTYNFLLETLSGIGQDYTDIYNKIKELSETRPELVELINRIGVPSINNTIQQQIFQMEFRQDFDKNKVDSHTTMLKIDGTIYVINANLQAVNDRIKELWKSNLFDLSVQDDTTGNLTIDALSISTISDDIKFLEALGIKFSDLTKREIEYNKDFNKAVIEIRKYIAEKKGNVTNLFTDKSDVKGNIKTLLNLESEFNDEINELSYMSTEGKTVYSIGLNNMLSIVKNIINNAKTLNEVYEKLPHLNSVTTRNSIYLNNLFDNNGNRREDVNIILDLHDGLKTEDSNTEIKKATRKLSTGDKYVQEINNILLYGRSSYLRASDKSTEFTISLNKFGRRQKLAIPTEELANGFDIYSLKEIFRGYFVDEFNRIAQFEINNLGKNIDIYNKAGGKWTIFESMEIPKKDIATEINLIKDQNLDSNALSIELDKVVKKYYKQVDKAVIKFFNDYAKDLTNELEENRISSQLGISKTLLENYSLDQLINSVVVNDFINSVEQTKLFIGDMSFYKDLFKRTSGATGTKETSAVGDDINNWLNNNNKRKDGKKASDNLNVIVFNDSVQSSNYYNEYLDSLVEANISKEISEKLLNSYKNMDEGDAQGWGTLDFFREFGIKLGNWDSRKEVAFDKLQKGEELTDNELVYFLVAKAQYFGPQNYNNLFVPTYHKFSIMPLIPQLVKGKNLENLLNTMTSQQIDYALFKSGSKVGTRVNEQGKANNFYVEGNSGEINTSNWDKQIVNYRFLGLQTKTSEPKDKNIFGTQFRKLLFSNLFSNGTSILKDSNIKELYDEYNAIISDMVKTAKKELIEELGIKANDDNYTSENVTKLVKLLSEEAKSRDLPDNIISALKTEEINGKVELKYKFDNMVNKDKIDSMLTALVNSRLIRQKINGDSLVQGASSGFEKLGIRKAGTNESLKFYRKDETTGKTLPMQVKVPMSKEYKGLLAEYSSLEALNKAIKEPNFDMKLITLVGYRIPTQGLNSIDFMEIEEFLPETVAMIILPTEIVAKSGGDYDIDKMNIFRYTTTSKTKIDKQQNRIIEIAKEILENPYNFNSLITPNSTSILTDVVDEFRYMEYVNRKTTKGETPEAKDAYLRNQKKNLSNIRYSNQLKLTTKVKQFVKFMLAKDMIGIAALQNTHHILAQAEDLSLNKSYFTKDGAIKNLEIFFPHHENKDNTISLSQIKDINGENYISEVISQIINATVDAAKDPFLFELNMNLETLGTYIYLIRIGVPFENVAYFMKQPIITDYLKELSINKSAFLVSRNKKLRNEELINKVRNKYRSNYNDVSSNLFFDNIELLKNNLKLENQNSKDFFKSQVQVLDNFLAYKDQAQLLSDSIKAVNHDTAGLGKNLGASHLKEKQLKEVLETGFVNGVDRILSNTFVGSMDQTDFSIKAYGQFYNMESDKVIVENTQNMLDLINPFIDNDKQKIRTLLENDFINFIVQNYGYSNTKELNSKLFKGVDSVAKRLLHIKNSNKKQDIELSENLLIKELYPLLNKVSGQDNVKIFAKRFDTFTANQLTEAFRELRISDHPEAQQLAKDLMDVGIIQSGLNNSPITYLGIIPYEYYNDIVKEGFNKFNQEENKQSIIDEFNKLFLRNNTENNLIYKAAKANNLDIFPIGHWIYGKDYVTDEFNKTLPNVSFNSSDIEEDNNNLQFKKKQDLEKELKDSGYIAKKDDQLWIKQNFFAEATNLINKINKQLGSQIITKKKLNHFGNGGRQIWKVIINESPEIQFSNNQDNNNISELAFREIVDKLKNKTGVEYEIVTPEEALKLLVEEYGADIAKMGLTVDTAPAFYTNNKIIFPNNFLTAEVAFHEFGHPFVDSILRDNKALFVRLKRELQDSEAGQSIIKQVKREYKDLVNKQNELTEKGWKEAITSSLGKLAEKQLSETKDKGLIDALKQLLKRIGDYLQSLFNDNNKVIKPVEITPTTTLAELASMLNIENKIDLKVPKNSNIVNYNLKALEFLSTEKATQLFNKFFNSNKDKFYQELTANIGKDQTELIKDIISTGEISSIGDIMTSLLANNSYTIEINTAKSIGIYSQYKESSDEENFIYNNIHYSIGADPNGEIYFKGNEEITKEKYFKDFENAKSLNQGSPTQHYSNLTVPGGTNYTESEIATPLITPSIKGHAQFATDKGIGWFRSDDKAISQMEQREMWNPFTQSVETYEEERGGIDPIKTRRILEVQSDLFQKGRDKNNLIINDGDSAFKYLGKPIKKQNDFLQLLNKDNNWVTFFVKSIIQDSAKKGYEKVLFPSGNTASKVEGHSTLEDFKKQKEDRIKELKKDNTNIKVEERNSKFYITEPFIKEVNSIEDGNNQLKTYIEKNNNEINQLQQELERVETEGFGALKPIFNFYENTVTNILNKTYGKDNVKVITDEYSNTWNEVNASNVDIQLKRRTESGQDNTRDEVKPKVEKSKESAFNKQKLFFETRLRTLNKRLKDSKKDSERYNRTLEEIEALKGKYDIAKKEDSEDLFFELGNNTLDKIDEFITKLEDGTARDTDENIILTIDALNTWSDFNNLRDKSANLLRRVLPFVNSSTLEQIKEYATEKDGVTQEMIDNQNTDVRTFTASVGSLSDSDNYIARTIGSIIKSAQNRVETQNKQVANKVQSEIDELANYAKKNGAKLDDIYKLFIQQHRGTTILAKEYLSGGVENTNWTKIQNTPELKRFYDFYQESINTSMENLPFIGIGGNKNFIPNIKKSDLKTKIKSLSAVSKRAIGKEFEEDNLPDVINLEYNKPIKFEEKSNNLGEVLLQFSMYSNNYTEMNTILPKVRILEQQLKYKIVNGTIQDRKFKKSSSPNLTINGKDTNLAKMVSTIIDMQVLGKMKSIQGVVTLDNHVDEKGKEIHKTFNTAEFIDNLLRYNSLLRIGLSPITAVSNVIFGDISNIMEAVGGRYMSIRGLHQATNIFFDKDSVLNQLLIELNPLQELDDYELLEKVRLVGESDKLSPEKIMELMYYPQKKGEKFLQSRTMLAVMIKDGYLTSSGKLTDNYKALTKKQKQQLSDKIQRLNQKIHGRYTTKEAAALSQNVLYRAVSQFRKWIPTAIENRIGSEKYDNRLQGEIEGIYLTFGRLVLKNWKSPKEAFSNLFLPLFASKKLLESDKMTESEIYNMRRMLTEILTASALILMYAGLHGGDDDEDKKFRKNALVKTGLTLLNRAAGDILFFYNPKQLNSLGKNAIPLSKTIDDIIQATMVIPTVLYNDEYVIKKGSNKGRYKIEKEFSDIIPLAKPVSDVRRLLSDNELEEL